MATGKPCKNILYFCFSCSYLKNELGDPNLLLHKSDQQVKVKLSAKFKKILWSGFRATLNFQLFEVALNPLHRIFLNFAESFILPCWLHFRNKKWGSPSSLLRYDQLKQKYGMFFSRLSCCHGNFLPHKNDHIFCLIWYHNIAVKWWSVVVSILPIRTFLSSVETGLSHFKFPNVWPVFLSIYW